MKSPGHYYYLTDTSANFSSSRAKCQETEYGDLLVINDVEEMVWVGENLARLGVAHIESIWIGIEKQEYGDWRSVVDGALVDTSTY